MFVNEAQHARCRKRVHAFEVTWDDDLWLRIAFSPGLARYRPRYPEILHAPPSAENGHLYTTPRTYTSRPGRHAHELAVAACVDPLS